MSEDEEQAFPKLSNQYQTGLFDCFSNKVKLQDNRGVEIDCLAVNLKACICPCLLLQENTNNMRLKPNSVLCQQRTGLSCCAIWVALPILFNFSEYHDMLLDWDNFDFLRKAKEFSPKPIHLRVKSELLNVGLYSIPASVRDALNIKYRITQGSGSLQTWLTVRCCLNCALAQEAREIKIREHIANSAHLDDSFEPPKVQEMNGIELLESSAHTLIYGEPKGHEEKSFLV